MHINYTCPVLKGKFRFCQASFFYPSVPITGKTFLCFISQKGGRMMLTTWGKKKNKRPYLKRLENLMICSCNYRGNTFFFIHFKRVKFCPTEILTSNHNIDELKIITLCQISQVGLEKNFLSVHTVVCQYQIFNYYRSFIPCFLQCKLGHQF